MRDMLNFMEFLQHGSIIEEDYQASVYDIESYMSLIMSC